MGDEVARRTGEWEGQHRTRAATVRGARTATSKAKKAGRMQEGYDVYHAATGREVDTGITGGESRSGYAKWAKSDEGKAAWKSRKRRKPADTSGRTAQDAGDAIARANQ